jgi:signal transduction histidine kinase
MNNFKPHSQDEPLPPHPANPVAIEAEIFKRLEALSKATLAISSELDLESVLQSIADNARKIGGADYAALGIVDKNGIITSFITSGITKEEREKIGEPPRGHGLLGVLIKQGKPLRVKDMSKDPRKSGFPPNHPPMTSLLGVPVSVQGRVVGDLYLTDKIEANEFTEGDEWWLTLFARQAAVAVEKAQVYKHKEEFLSMIAHDLRAPLTAIKMSAGLLEDNMPVDLAPPLSRLVSNIKRNSERLSSMLEDLLELTRLEQGRVQFRLESLELGEAVATLLPSLLPLFEEKNQSLNYDRPAENYYLLVDRRRFEQVLTNLLVNAHKYVQPGGHVNIEINSSTTEVTIGIKDNGPGIPPEEQRYIFDRYYRRPMHEQSLETSGSGLGLPIARQLVELQGGKIWVESTVGQGSTFFIKFLLDKLL